MRDAIGALRARVQLQSPSRAEDDLGGAAITWASQGSAWAEIEALGASQSVGFDTAPSTASYRVTLRARGDVRTGWRVVWGARTFRVFGVTNDGGPHIALNCEEEIL